MKSDFLNAISHELRTPLAPILGYTEILLSGGMGTLPPASVRGIQAIDESAKRLLRLIESLLAFIRLDQGGGVALNREPVDLAALFSRVAETFQARVTERKQSLQLCCGEGLLPVQADPQELVMALTHLVDNATKFTPTGGTITLRAKPATDEDGKPAVEVTVEDSGIGIPPDLHEKIFDRFFQVDSSPTRQFGGVGIGLAVVKQIIEAHGSRIRVESQPDKGSTFGFTLPVSG